MTDGLIVWLLDCFFDSLIDWSMANLGWVSARLMPGLTMPYWLVRRMLGWLIDLHLDERLTATLYYCWLHRWMSDRVWLGIWDVWLLGDGYIACSFHWLIDCLYWLCDRLVWKDGWSIVSLFHLLIGNCLVMWPYDKMASGGFAWMYSFVLFYFLFFTGYLQFTVGSFRWVSPSFFL